jgi:hypothetical protein
LREIRKTLREAEVESPKVRGKVRGKVQKLRDEISGVLLLYSSTVGVGLCAWDREERDGRERDKGSSAGAKGEAKLPGGFKVVGNSTAPSEWGKGEILI